MIIDGIHNALVAGQVWKRRYFVLKPATFLYYFLSEVGNEHINSHTSRTDQGWK
jgi:hypothetical protein